MCYYFFSTFVYIWQAFDVSNIISREDDYAKER